jgi:hypothetical protein
MLTCLSCGAPLFCSTSSLEEKATACNMLCCYADELKDGFLPYVKQVRDQVLMPRMPGIRAIPTSCCLLV